MTNTQTLVRYFMPALCFAAAGNALLPSMLYAIQQQSLITALSGGLGHSFVIWLCFALSIKVCMQYPTQLQPLEPWHWLCLVLLSAALLIPSALLAWLICIGFCLIWHARVKHNGKATLAPIMLLAIACRDPICQSFLNLFAAQVLSVDAMLSGIILYLSNHAADISANTLTQANGHSLLILTGCSAFTNLSLALLLWLCISLYRHHSLSSAGRIRPFLLLLTILGLNSARLALMAIDKQWYELLHGPQAQQVIEFITILISVLFIKRRDRHENIADNRPADTHRYHRAVKSRVKPY